jgi:hypothetical protein
MVFDSNGGAGPAHHPGGASTSENRQQQTSLPFSGVRKPTPGSTRIVSMQSSSVGTATGTGGGARGEPATDRIATRVNSSAMQPLPLYLPSSLLPLSFALAYDPLL